MVLLQLGLKANRLTLAAEGVHGITSKPVIWILQGRLPSPAEVRRPHGGRLGQGVAEVDRQPPYPCKIHPNIMVNCFCLLMNQAVGYIVVLIIYMPLLSAG